MPPMDAQAAIAAANAQFVAAFNRGDAAGVAACYTESAQLLPPNMDIMTGRAAIQPFWQGAMDMGLAEAKLETREVMDYGETAVELGNYVLNLVDGQMADTGKYIVVWKLEDGQLKLHRDIYNSSLPPAGS